MKCIEHLGGAMDDLEDIVVFEGLPKKPLEKSGDVLSKPFAGSNVTTYAPADIKPTEPEITPTPKTPRVPKPKSEPAQTTDGTQVTQTVQSAQRISAKTVLTPEEVKALQATLKSEAKARIDAENVLEKTKQHYERIIEKLRMDQDKVILAAQKAAQAEVDKMKDYVDRATKAAHAETAKVKFEAERDRAKAKKLYDTVIDKAKKDLERSVERQKRAEKTAIERSSQAAERSRQVASLRMELSRERMKGASVTNEPTGFGQQASAKNGQEQNGAQQIGGHGQQIGQQIGSQQIPPHQQNPLFPNHGIGHQMPVPFGLAPQFGSPVDSINNIQSMLTELVIRMRTAPQTPFPQSPGVSPELLALLLRQQGGQPTMIAPVIATPDTTNAEALRVQQEAMNVQMAQQQAKFDALIRKQQEAADEMARKQKEVTEDLERKQRYAEEDIARKQQIAEEEFARKQQLAEEELVKKQQADEEAWKKQYNEKMAAAAAPTVDEVADSLDNEMVNRGGRGGMAHSATLSISDFLKKRDVGYTPNESQTTSQPRYSSLSATPAPAAPVPATASVDEAVAPHVAALFEQTAPTSSQSAVKATPVVESLEDPLDDLIANLSRELNELKDALGDKNKKDS